MGSLKDDFFVKSLSNMVIKETMADAESESGNKCGRIKNPFRTSLIDLIVRTKCI